MQESNISQCAAKHTYPCDRAIYYLFIVALSFPHALQTDVDTLLCSIILGKHVFCSLCECMCTSVSARAPVCTWWQKVGIISIKAGAADIRRTPSLLSACWDVFSSSRVAQPITLTMEPSF